MFDNIGDWLEALAAIVTVTEGVIAPVKWIKTNRKGH